MRFFGRSLMGLVLAAMTAGLLALAANLILGAVRDSAAGAGGGPPARERVFSASVARIEPGRIEPQMEAFGEVRSRRTLELRAPAGGTVAELAPEFEDGAAVTAGQVLLRLDPARAQATRDLAAAALAEAEAEQRQATGAVQLSRDDLAAAMAQADLRQGALKRQQDLQARGVGSAAAVETAALAASSEAQSVVSRRQALASSEARVDQARAALVRARITLTEAERGLEETVLYAEFSGRLNGVAVVEGGLVSPNERLAEIIDPDALEVAIRLSTVQFGRLLDADGALVPVAVTITLEGQGAMSGRLTRAGAAVGAGQSGRVVYAALDGALGLKPGDFVTVQIAEPALDGVALLPATALDGAGGVLVLGPDDRLEAMTVEILRRQGDGVIVRAGAVAGREVVTERSPLLGAGIRIKAVREGDAPQAAAQAPDMVELTPERRAELIAQVKANTRMPDEAKARVLDQLAQDRVPAQVIKRLEERAGG